MVRVWLRIAVLAAAGVLAASCSPDTPNQRYVCACDVGTGPSASTLNVTLCEPSDDEVTADANAQCTRETSQTCACSCTRSGDCNTNF